MALDLGTLVARLRVENNMRRGLDQGRRDMDQFTRDANGRLRDLRGRFISEGQAMGRGLGEGISAGGRRGIDAFTRDANGRLRDARGRFVSAARAAGEGVGDGLDGGSRRGIGRFSGALDGLGDRLGALGRQGAKGIGELASSFGKLVKENPKMALGLVAGAIAGLPLITGIAASAITVGLGGALAQLGIKAAASATAVKDSFDDLKDDLRDGLRDAAAPFEGSLIRMIGVARKELGGLKEDVGRSFATLAPSIERAFGSVAKAVGSVGPALGLISQKAGPLIEVLGRELGSLVESLAGNFTRLAEAADPRFIEILIGSVRVLGDVLTDVIVKGSQFGSWLLDLVGMDRPAASARDLGEAFGEVATGARDASEAVQAASDTIARYIDPSLAVFDANISLKRSFQDLAKSALEADGSMRGNSEAALKFKEDLSGTVRGVLDLYKANLANRDMTDEAKAELERSLPVLYAFAQGNKDAADEIDNIVDQLGLTAGAIPKTEAGFVKLAGVLGITEDAARQVYRQLDKPATIKANITDLETKLKAAKAQLDTVPKEKKPKLLADISELQRKIRQAKRDLAALQDKTVRITTIYSTPSKKIDPMERRGFSTGGLVDGPGTETSDSIPAMLSRGEYVLPAKTVRRIGVKRLDALRKAGGIGAGTSAMVDSGPVAATGTYGGLGPGVGASSGSSSLASDLAKARRKMLKEIEQQITTLKAGLKKIRAAREDLLDGLTSMSADTVKSTANSLSAMVKEAFAGFRATTKIDDALLGRIKSTSAQLQRLADERTKIAERLQEALQFAASVTSRAQADSSVLGIEVVDAEGNRVDPTGAELATGLKTRLETLRKFSGDIRNLAAQGLSQTILRDLMEAGPAAAGGIAEAIGQGGSGVIAELNNLQNQIDAESKALGEFSADHLYDAGAQAGQGFLTGLTGQLETLEATMETLATNLINTVTTAIAAAQAAAEKKAKEIAEEGVGAKAGRGGKGKGPQDSETGLASEGSMSSDKIGVGKLPAGKVGVGQASGRGLTLNIGTYNEARGGNARRTGEELLLLTRARG